MSKKDKYKVAMVGATGAVGETLLSVLAERKFPISELVPLASERSAGDKVEFNGKQLTVKNLADYDFAGVDIAFFSAGGSVSKVHAPRAAASPCAAISCARMRARCLYAIGSWVGRATDAAASFLLCRLFFFARHSRAGESSP